MIEHHHRLAAGTQDPEHFPKRARGIGGVMEDAERVDDIERTVREGKVLRVSDEKRAR